MIAHEDASYGTPEPSVGIQRRFTTRRCDAHEIFGVAVHEDGLGHCALKRCKAQPGMRGKYTGMARYHRPPLFADAGRLHMRVLRVYIYVLQAFYSKRRDYNI